MLFFNGFSFNATNFFLLFCVFCINVLPIYLLFVNTKSYGIFDSFEYPNAASIPESGTAATISASTGICVAKNLPAFSLNSCTLIPSNIESGLAKYIYSNTHIPFFSLLS